MSYTAPFANNCLLGLLVDPHCDSGELFGSFMHRYLGVLQRLFQIVSNIGGTSL